MVSRLPANHRRHPYAMLPARYYPPLDSCAYTISDSFSETQKALVHFGGRGLIAASWCHHHSLPQEPQSITNGGNAKAWFVALKRARPGLTTAAPKRTWRWFAKTAQGCRCWGPKTALTAAAPLSEHRERSQHVPVVACCYCEM